MAVPVFKWHVRINPLHVDSTWWDNARGSPDAPSVLAPMLDPIGEEEIAVSEAEAQAIQVWAAALPDWDRAQPQLLIGRNAA